MIDFGHFRILAHAYAGGASTDGSEAKLGQPELDSM
jgi:hypothetical protein